MITTPYESPKIEKETHYFKMGVGDENIWSSLYVAPSTFANVFQRTQITSQILIPSTVTDLEPIDINSYYRVS